MRTNMQTTNDAQTDTDYLALVREAANWPTPRELAEQYDVPEWWVRRYIERGEVEAIKLAVIRVNPTSWTAFLAARHYRTT